MAKISYIPENYQRFIDRNRLEKIKTRIGRVPSGFYQVGPPGASMVYVCYLDEDGRETGDVSNIAYIHYPGALDAFLHMKEDIEALVRHVENADKENDILLEKLKKYENLIGEIGN
jgi:hypothetical protein